MSDTDQLPRETGAEKSGGICPTCGSEMNRTSETVYGSYVGECPSCDAEPVADPVAVQAAAEAVDTSRETGTQVPSTEATDDDH